MLNRMGADKAQYIVGEFKTLLCFIYIFLSFYEGYLNQLIGSNTKYFLMGLIIIFLFGYGRIKIRGYHFIILVWLILKFASILWASSNSFALSTVTSHWLSQIGMVLFFCTMTIVDFDKRFVWRMINASMYASVAMGLLGLFFSQPYLFSIEGRKVLTLFGQQIDPNNLAAFYLVGVVIASYYIVFERKQILRNGFFLLINGMAMILTASRGGLISFLALIVFMVLLTNARDNKVLDSLKKIFFISAIVVAVYYIASHFMPQASIERLFSLNLYEGGSGRDDLWAYAIKLIKEKPIIGWGWGGYESGIHNTYLSMVCDLGIVGGTFFGIFLVMIGSKALKSRQPLAILILIAGLAPAFFIDAINKRFFWNAIIIATMVVNSYSYCEKKNKLRDMKNLGDSA